MVAQRPIEERMNELQQRIEALRQTKAQLEARLAAAERKRQERRRYLLGSFLLDRLGQDGAWRELVRHELPLFLKEERDRKLFSELLAGQGSNGVVEEGERAQETELSRNREVPPSCQWADSPEHQAEGNAPPA